MEKNLEAVKKQARNLASEEPRSPSEQLAGFPLAARALDKCRATLAGTNADFTFGCPMDQQFFNSAGIKADDFKAFVATGASDSDVESWLKKNAKK
jgi:hypothetical protein